MASPIATAYRPISANRRAEPRSKVVDTAARIAWRGARKSMIQSPARLIDISERGARIASTTARPRGMSLWLGLKSLPMEWVRARVVAIEASEETWTLRLGFDEPCPPGLLEWAVCGKDPYSLPSRIIDPWGAGGGEVQGWDFPRSWD